MTPQFCCACAWVFAALAAGPTTPPIPSEGLTTARIGRRVVRTFDFDERRLGNFEAIPMNWRPIHAPGYPRFLQGTFDHHLGHEAPPSFRLTIEGGSVGSHYLAKDIPIHPGSRYRIAGWIRPDGLWRAGAYLTAYYLDDALRKIAQSQRRSETVRSNLDSNDWRQVIVELPAGEERARWIGLSCHVEEPPPPQDGGLIHPVHYRDARGGAWFDDIVVMRLPIVRMELDSRTGLYPPGVSPKCRIAVQDLDGEGLTIHFDVRDAAARTVLSRHLDGPSLLRTPQTATLDELPAGTYDVSLSVAADQIELCSLRRRIAQLSGRIREGPRADGFGVVLDASALEAPALVHELLAALSPAAAKLPLWRADLTDEEVVRGDPRADALIHSLAPLSISAIGVLEAPPERLAGQYERNQRSLWQILASDTRRWGPYLGFILTRHGEQISAWQIGADGDGIWGPDGPKPQQGLAGIRALMTPLIGDPRLAATRLAHEDGAGVEGARDLWAVQIPEESASSRLRDQLGGSDDSSPFWATVAALDEGRYERRARLAEFARRVVEARCCDAQIVFVPQPWRIIHDRSETFAEPFEEFILFRALADLLGGLKPAGDVRIASGAQGRLFASPDHCEGALVVWSDAVSGPSRTVPMDLGDRANAHDLWGNRSRPRVERNEQLLTLAALPVVYYPVAPWRVRMLSDFALDRPTIEPRIEEHQRTLLLRNLHDETVSGLLRLDAPAGWRIRPEIVPIELPPGQSAAIPMALRIPSNQAAGDYALVARLETEDQRLPDLTLRAPIRIAVPGLDVNLMASRSGSALRVVQRVTNRTDGPLDLRCSVIAPGRPRVSQTLRNLAADQTALPEYLLDGAADLAGATIRVSVEEIGGSLRFNQVLTLDDPSGLPE